MSISRQRVKKRVSKEQQQQWVWRAGTHYLFFYFFSFFSLPHRVPDVSGNMSKSAYNPIAVESAWYDWWSSEGFFRPRYKSSAISPDGTEVNGGKDQEIRDEGVFVIPQPPPNVTGSLHTGHALAATLQDTLIRWYVVSSVDDTT
jgi:valyl-tRNA synthetase